MPPASADVLSRSALEQARLIRAREISSEELVRLYLGRIERHDGPLTSFVQVLGARALRAARKKDRGTMRARDLPPFHGVPVGVKDLNLVRGAFCRMGSRAFRWFWSPVDDKLVAQLRRAGFVIVGKLSTSELGAMPVTEPDIHPPTRNPWNLDHTSGGSSGGAGAAVAANLLPIAQGSDGAGSIRIPAAFCGLYGLKPSRGRLANAYGMPDDHILYTDGPIARDVADAAAMLDVMAGVTVGRPHTAPLPSRSFSELARDAPRGLRVRMVLSNPISAVDPEVKDAVRRAARVLEALGHHIEEVDPPAGSIEEFLPIWQHIVSTAPVLFASKLQPVTRWLAREGRRHDGRRVLALQHQLAARHLEWCEGADLILSPTTPRPAPRVGAFASEDPSRTFFGAAPLGAFTAPFNLTGQPAASLPLAVSSAGLPIGVQLGGKLLDDATVLAVSRQLEEALPWAGRTSPVAAAT
ncbi:MAG: amidase [Deltaproteobacteria bacterium]|nr:amidase [Deltaproteobacteria bacterium]